MFLKLTRAYLDELKIHDLEDPSSIPYALRAAKRTKAPRRVEETRPFRHGIADHSVPYFGAQIFTLAGYCRDLNGGDAETLEAYDVLSGLLSSPGAHTFRFLRAGRTTEEQATVKLADDLDTGAEGFQETIRWAVSLVGADPRIYAATLSVHSYDPTGALSGGGAAMPLVFPLVFSTTTATALVANNLGKAPTPPTFTIHGPVENPIVDNDSIGASVVLGVSLGSSDEVEIDVANRDVLLNGVSRRDLLELSGTRWFELQPGENLLRLRGTGMAEGVTSLTVAFREARW